MEQRLAGHDWLVGSGYTVADIALYAYTHCAGEGGFDLAAAGAVAGRAGLRRRALPPRTARLILGTMS